MIPSKKESKKLLFLTSFCFSFLLFVAGLFVAPLLVKNKTTSIYTIDLANNKIKSLAGLKGLKKLRKLDLGANRIRILDVDELSELTNLEELWIGKNKIEKIEGLEKVRDERDCRDCCNGFDLSLFAFLFVFSFRACTVSLTKELLFFFFISYDILFGTLFIIR